MKSKRFMGVASSYSGEKEADLLFFSTNEKGRLREEGRFRIGQNPSFLCKVKDTLYIGLEKPDEAVILSYLVTVDDRVRIEQTGQISIDASDLCHIWCGKEVIYGCCYGSGHVFAVDQKLHDIIWKICPDMEKDITPHAHCSIETDDGKMLVEVDLGMDTVYGIPLLDGTVVGDKIILTSISGMGPRQVLYEKHTKQFLVVGEQGNSIAGFEWISGQPTSLNMWTQKWVIPATKFSGTNYPGGACSTEEGILFWGNRGADTIGVASIGEAVQYIGEWPCEGSWPRSVLASHDCVFVACQKSGTVESFIWDGSILTKADYLKLEGAACVIGWDFLEERLTE